MENAFFKPWMLLVIIVIFVLLFLTVIKDRLMPMLILP